MAPWSNVVSSRCRHSSWLTSSMGPGRSTDRLSPAGPLRRCPAQLFGQAHLPRLRPSLHLPRPRAVVAVPAPGLEGRLPRRSEAVRLHGLLVSRGEEGAALSHVRAGPRTRDRHRAGSINRVADPYVQATRLKASARSSIQACNTRFRSGTPRACRRLRWRNGMASSAKSVYLLDRRACSRPSRARKGYTGERCLSRGRLY